MRDTFIRTLLELAKADPNIELVTGDLGFGVLKPFWEACPNQFTNAGIAEQNMPSLAAGMALEGKIVFIYTIGNFPTLRCLEQIRNDCAYHKLNVNIVCIGGGFVYGALGMSHQATEDMAIMRALPDMCVLAPGDADEASACARAMVNYPGASYIRLGRGGERKIRERIDNFKIGRAIPVQEGERVAVFSTGAVYDEVAEALNQLKQHGIDPAVYTFPTVKPIDVETVINCAERYDLIVTVEEHNILGGLGGAVAEIMAEMKSKKAYLHRIGLNDVYASSVGDQKYLRREYGICADAIANFIMQEVKEEE